jgi:hypothetical protein
MHLLHYLSESQTVFYGTLRLRGTPFEKQWPDQRYEGVWLERQNSTHL